MNHCILSLTTGGDAPRWKLHKNQITNLSFRDTSFTNIVEIKILKINTRCQVEKFFVTHPDKVPDKIYWDI